MKFVIVGLGNFGAALALKLAEGRHEVIGVDQDDRRVDTYKDKLTYTLQMDSTSEEAVEELPLADTDTVIIAIGEDGGAAITTAALFKKHVPSCRIVARVSKAIHQPIFEAMGIDETVNPEVEYVNEFAGRLTISGSLNFMHLDNKHEIAEIEVPKAFVGKHVHEIEIVQRYGVSLITVIREKTRKNIIGRKIRTREVLGVVDGSTLFEESDILVVFGQMKALEKMMEDVGD